jgi:NADPH:quinone reductase
MSEPASVPAVRIRESGGPDVLYLDSVRLAAPGPGEVRVRVATSGVNRADLLQRRGAYPPPRGFPPDVPGLEYAGVVEAVGPGCHLRRPGDRVMGILGGGGYAAALNVEERETVRVPDGLSIQEAGAIPEVFITAWDALFLQAGLSAGETLLIHAVGSGVGTAALQLAVSAGVRTLGTSRTPRKVERARALGLDVGIHAEGDWPRAVHEATAGGGVDVVLDLVGGSYAEGNLAVLASGARWVVVGVPGGRKAEIDLRALMGRRARIQGTVLRARPPEEKATLAREFERVVVPRFETGALRPVVDAILPAARAPDAHRRLEVGDTFGKVLLSW